MNIQLKLLMGGTIVFVLLMGVWFWWLGRPAGVLVDQITEVPSGSGVQTSNTNTTETSVQPKNIATPIVFPIPDIDAKYDALYARLNASRVEFVPLEQGAAYKSVYALYAADIAAYKKALPSASNPPLLMALIDVDGDGKDEVLVYEDFRGYCGPAGCTIELLKSDKSGWKKLLSTAAYKQVGVSYVVSGGYAVLYLAVQGDDLTYQSKVVRYVATNGLYNPDAEVAYWDGAAFKTPRSR